MTIYIHCPHCNARLETMGQECAHCHAELPPGVLYALSVALGLTPMPPPGPTVGQRPPHLSPASTAATSTRQEFQARPAHHSALRPWLAALLSIVCGLGQLYNGQILKGTVLLLGGLAVVLTWPLAPVQVLAPFLWLYAMADAYLVARRLTPRAAP